MANRSGNAQWGILRMTGGGYLSAIVTKVLVLICRRPLADCADFLARQDAANSLRREPP